MNVINIGGWYVGNTAVLDWLDGFDELAFVKGDFNVTRLENGVMDMIAVTDKNKKLTMIAHQKKDCYLGFYRVTKSFVGRYTKNLLKPRLSKSYNAHLGFFIDYYKFLSNYEKKIINNEVFDEIEFWKCWLGTLPSLDSSHKKFTQTVWQNPFFYDETFDGHKDIWPALFAPYKMIFVHREPLDQLADIVAKGDHLISSWPRFHGGTEEMHPADRYFTIAKKLYLARLRMAENYTKNDLVIFSFEDFLQEHDRVTKSLKLFLGIKGSRDPNNKRFVRENSIKNIGKGENNLEVLKLLEGKPYILRELNELRDKLSSHPLAI